jgi:hypothetical protein
MSLLRLILQRTPRKREAKLQQTAVDSPATPRLRSAGILLTYKCSARCRHCRYACGPHKGGLIPLEKAGEYFSALKRLGVPSEGIQVTGGEPLLYAGHLRNILRVFLEIYGNAVGVLETNGFWCRDESRTRKVLDVLKGLTRRVRFSRDAYHAEWVPVSFVDRGFRLASEVIEGRQAQLGNNVRPVVAQRVAELVKAGGRRLSMTGNAAYAIAPYLRQQRAEAFGAKRCMDELFTRFDSIHLDPYGNVFFGSRCIGILAGNADRTEGGLVEVIRKAQDPARFRENPIVKVLVDEGPLGLLRLAERLGYKREKGYASPCHMCHLVRSHLVSKGYFGDFLGPEEVYLPTSDKELDPMVRLKAEQRT